MVGGASDSSNSRPCSQKSRTNPGDYEHDGDDEHGDDGDERGVGR